MVRARLPPRLLPRIQRQGSFADGTPSPAVARGIGFDDPHRPPARTRAISIGRAGAVIVP